MSSWKNPVESEVYCDFLFCLEDHVAGIALPNKRGQQSIAHDLWFTADPIERQGSKENDGAPRVG